MTIDHIIRKQNKIILTRNVSIKEDKRDAKQGKIYIAYVYMISKFKSKGMQRDYLDRHSFLVRLKLASYTHKKSN